MDLKSGIGKTTFGFMKLIDSDDIDLFSDAYSNAITKILSYYMLFNDNNVEKCSKRMFVFDEKNNMLWYLFDVLLSTPLKRDILKRRMGVISPRIVNMKWLLADKHYNNLDFASKKYFEYFSRSMF